MVVAMTTAVAVEALVVSVAGAIAAEEKVAAGKVADWAKGVRREASMEARMVVRVAARVAARVKVAERGRGKMYYYHALRKVSLSSSTTTTSLIK